MKSTEEIRSEILKLSQQLVSNGTDTLRVLSQICELRSQLADSFMQIQLPEPKKEWPQVGDEYESINHLGSISTSDWEDNSIDNERKAFGNVFRPGTAAKELSYLQFERDVRAYAQELNDGWVADWSDETQTKWVVKFTNNGALVIDRYENTYVVMIRGSECRSREAAQALLDKFGAEKFLAYATGGVL